MLTAAKPFASTFVVWLFVICSVLAVPSSPIDNEDKTRPLPNLAKYKDVLAEIHTDLSKMFAVRFSFSVQITESEMRNVPRPNIFLLS